MCACVSVYEVRDAAEGGESYDVPKFSPLLGSQLCDNVLLIVLWFQVDIIKVVLDGIYYCNIS